MKISTKLAQNFKDMKKDKSFQEQRRNSWV